MISFAHSLPRLPSELFVRKEKKQSHHDFRVRRAAVQEALEWLCYRTTSTTEQTRYTSIKMYFNNSHRMVIYQSCMTSLQLDESATNEHSQPSQEDLYGAHIPSSFVPNAQQHQTEQETVRQSIEELQGAWISPYPHVADYWWNTNQVVTT